MIFVFFLCPGTPLRGISFFSSQYPGIGALAAEVHRLIASPHFSQLLRYIQFHPALMQGRRCGYLFRSSRNCSHVVRPASSGDGRRWRQSSIILSRPAFLLPSPPSSGRLANSISSWISPGQTSSHTRGRLVLPVGRKACACSRPALYSLRTPHVPRRAGAAP